MQNDILSPYVQRYGWAFKLYSHTDASHIIRKIEIYMDMVGNSKSNDVDFKRIEIDESNANNVQENKDYIEMVQSDVNCIWGHPSNVFFLRWSTITIS